MRRLAKVNDLENCGAILLICLWGRCGGYPPQKGEAEDRRKPGCSVGEGFPPFIFLLMIVPMPL
jgi:hypothetical protein